MHTFVNNPFSNQIIHWVITASTLVSGVPGSQSAFGTVTACGEEGFAEVLRRREGQLGTWGCTLLAHVNCFRSVGLILTRLKLCLDGWLDPYGHGRSEELRALRKRPSGEG